MGFLYIKFKICNIQLAEVHHDEKRGWVVFFVYFCYVFHNNIP